MDTRAATVADVHPDAWLAGASKRRGKEWLAEHGPREGSKA